MPSWGAVPKEIRARFQPPPDKCRFSSVEEYEEALGYWQGHIGRALGFAMQRHRETPRRIFYRVVPHNGGLVFAEPERAEHIARIHSAINSSKTWREFRCAMPKDEWVKIIELAFDDNDESQPADDEAFDAEAIPGWSDGDYPSWLQKEQDCVLPERILTDFAHSIVTPINGKYWHIPEDQSVALCNFLRKLGFSVECRQDLPFH